VLAKRIEQVAQQDIHVSSHIGVFGSDRMDKTTHNSKNPMQFSTLLKGAVAAQRAAQDSGQASHIVVGGTAKRKKNRISIA
jgi:hypothetical protein